MKKILTLLTFALLLFSTISFIAYSNSPQENLFPHKRITKENIQVLDDKIIINIKDPYYTLYANTDSMLPLIDQGAIGLEIKPDSKKDIHVGDIVAYQYGEDLLAHRIIKIGSDNLGWYAIAKGDNLSNPDPKKIRFNQIKYILIGVLY